MKREITVLREDLNKTRSTAPAFAAAPAAASSEPGTPCSVSRWGVDAPNGFSLARTFPKKERNSSRPIDTPPFSSDLLPSSFDKQLFLSSDSPARSSTPAIAVSFEEASNMHRLAFVKESASPFHFVSRVETRSPIMAPELTDPSALSTPILPSPIPVKSPFMRGSPTRDYRCLLPFENDAVKHAAQLFFDAFYRHNNAVNALKELQSCRNPGSDKDKPGVNTTILFSLITIQDSKAPICLISFSGIYRDRARVTENNNRFDLSKSAQELAIKCYSEIEAVIDALNKQSPRAITYQLIDRASTDINKLLVGAEKILHGEYVSDLSVHAESARRCAERSVLSELMVKNEQYGSVSIIGLQAYALTGDRRDCRSISACDLCLKQMLAFYALIRLAKITYCFPNFLEHYALGHIVDYQQIQAPFQTELQMLMLITESLAERICLIRDFYTEIDKHSPDTAKVIDTVLSFLTGEMRKLVLDIERYYDRVYAQHPIQVALDVTKHSPLSLSPAQFFQRNSEQNRQEALTVYRNSEINALEMLCVIASIKRTTSQFIKETKKKQEPCEKTLRITVKIELEAAGLAALWQSFYDNFKQGMHTHLKSSAGTTGIAFGKTLQNSLEPVNCKLPINFPDDLSIEDFHAQLISVEKTLRQLLPIIQEQIRQCQITIDCSTPLCEYS